LIVTEIAESRTADNVVNKVEAFQQELNLPEESLHLTEASSPVRLGKAVLKLGIPTTFTRGQVIDDVALKWNPDSTLSGSLSSPPTIQISTWLPYHHTFIPLNDRTNDSMSV
jgi:hypothetical protein